MPENKELTPEEIFDQEFDAAYDEEEPSAEQEEAEEIEQETVEQPDQEDEDEPVETAGEEAEPPDEKKEYSEAIERENSQAELDKLRQQLAAVSQERDQWVQRYRSDEGRIKAAQKKLSGQGPTKEEVRTALKDTDKWKEFQSTWGEHAEVLEAVREDILQEVRQQYQQSSEDTQQRFAYLERQHDEIARQRAVRQAHSHLDTIKPGWREIDNSPEFTAWVKAQPPKKQEYIMTSASYGMVPELAGVFDEFEHYQRAADYANREAEARKKAEQRDKRLERSQSIPSNTGSVGKPSAEPKDFDTVFESIT